MGCVARGGSDLYIADSPTDDGTAPGTPGAVMWECEDIWVNRAPHPNWQPNPFTGPVTWRVHENPEFRTPLWSKPNFVYVKVTNRTGATGSSAGTEHLHLYWAKASSGLAWPASWSNNLANPCGGAPKLYGQEITKPRKNAANATSDERSRFINAIAAMDNGAFFYTNAPGVTFWDKQIEVNGQRETDATYGFSHNPAYLPWQREFIGRMEILLQQYDPTVTLLYWDWTTDPHSTPALPPAGPVNLFGSTWMGKDIGTMSALTPVGIPFNALTPQPNRRVASGAPAVTPDAVMLGTPTYEDGPAMSGVQGFCTVNQLAQNLARGLFGTGSDMSNALNCTRDPFYYLMQANADRLWAMWQRDVTHLDRLRTNRVYGGDSPHPLLNDYLRPWGPQATTRTPANTDILPWGAAGDLTFHKTPTHPALVSPPVYDTAPVLIPVLAPGKSVVLQIPWYPPNRDDLACPGDPEPGHYCLLARIEGEPMSSPETANVYENTRLNNNIAWKNVSVVNPAPGAPEPLLLAGPGGGPSPKGFRAQSSTLVQNPFEKPVNARLRFLTPRSSRGATLFDYGQVRVDLGAELFKRWHQSGGTGQGVEPVGGTVVQLFNPDASITGVPLEPKAAFALHLVFELSPDYRDPEGDTFGWDLIQYGTPDDPNAILGGNHFDLDFNEVLLVGRGSSWRYWDRTNAPGADWVFGGFPDDKWRAGQADLGFGLPVNTTLNAGSAKQPLVTAYFRRKFQLLDPALVHNVVLRLACDDGAIVYLNGHEIRRFNLPDGRVSDQTRATRDVTGVAEEAFYSWTVADAGQFLQPGENLVAVEVHQAQGTNGVADLRFDLELSANARLTNAPPYLRLAQIPDGAQYGQTQPVIFNADTLDVDGSIKGVEFEVDGVPVGAAFEPPFQLVLPPLPLGPHTLRAVAHDNLGASRSVDSQIEVVGNLLPAAQLTAPLVSPLPQGTPITLSAIAWDNDGTVTSVEFFAQPLDSADSPARSLGLVVAPPYVTTVTDLAPGPYLLTAVAQDDLGGLSEAPPGSIRVLSRALAIQLENGGVVTSWDDAAALLESAPALAGPWTTIGGAVSPHTEAPAGAQHFYRLRWP